MYVVKCTLYQCMMYIVCMYVYTRVLYNMYDTVCCTCARTVVHEGQDYL